MVGGGTAGWLSALILREAGQRGGLDLEIQVVESSTIPTIGVGEGTTSVFRGLLQELGIDEFEFLRETRATIKYGIRHKDWRRLGHAYDGPIDDPQAVHASPAGPWLNRYCIASGRSVTEPHLFTYLMARGKAPFVLRSGKSPLPIGPFHHAYHFDQAAVGAFLRGKAMGITHVDALVEGAGLDPETGHIQYLETGDGRRLDADFFVDCTGFRRTLIGGQMGATWVGYGACLPVNRAMSFGLDHEPDAEIAPLTLAHALRSGWMWQIPTQDRIGCGYVYSDAHLSPNQAQAEVETVLGHGIEPRADIPINAGRLDRAWVGNCLATGLAQSFFEPLEATSIHGTVVQMMLFTQRHLADVVDGKVEPDLYNADIAGQADDFCAFISTHYVSERRDTPFWEHVAAECLSGDVRERLALWQRKTPTRGDFRAFPGGLPHVEDQLYVPVLDGLGLTSRAAAKAELASDPKLRAHARKTTEALARDFRRAASKAASHRSFLEAL